MKMNIGEFKIVQNYMAVMLEKVFDSSETAQIIPDELGTARLFFENELEKIKDDFSFELLGLDASSGSKEIIESKESKESKESTKSSGSNQTEKEKLNILLPAFDTYVSHLTEYLGGTNETHKKIVKLILTITPQNQNSHSSLLQKEITSLEKNNVDNQAFLLKASSALLCVTSPILNKNYKEKIKEIVAIQENTDPETDKLQPSKYQLRLESTDSKQDQFVEKPKEVKENKKPEEKKAISEKVLLPFLNYIGNGNTNHGKEAQYNKMSMLELAIKYYKENEGNFGTNEAYFKLLIHKLFSSCVTPKVLHRIVRKGKNILHDDDDAMRLGIALLKLSSLKSQQLFDEQVSFLMDESNKIGANLKQDFNWEKNYSKWVSSSIQEMSTTQEDEKTGCCPGSFERTRRITKIIMLPMLENLQKINETIIPLYCSEKGKKNQANNKNKDKKPGEKGGYRKVETDEKGITDEKKMQEQHKERFPHHSSLFIQQSIAEESTFVGIDKEEAELYNDPSLLFVQEMRGIVHASLFSMTNRYREKDKELQWFQPKNTFAAVQAVDAFNNLLEAGMKPGEPIDKLVTVAHDKYVGMYPAGYLEKSHLDRNLRLMMIIGITVLAFGALAALALFCAPLMGLVLTFTAIKAASILTYMLAALGSGLSTGVMIAGVAKYYRQPDHYVKNNKPCKSADHYYGKVKYLNTNISGNGFFKNESLSDGIIRKAAKLVGDNVKTIGPAGK